MRLHSNRAECYLRNGQLREAEVEASAALVLDEWHGKSLMRRARARAKARTEESLSAAAVDLRTLVAYDGGHFELRRRALGPRTP